jgi:hypothetical protein
MEHSFVYYIFICEQHIRKISTGQYVANASYASSPITGYPFSDEERDDITPLFDALLL